MSRVKPNQGFIELGLKNKQKLCISIGYGYFANEKDIDWFVIVSKYLKQQSYP